MGKFVIGPSQNNKYCFKFVADNGQTILVNNGYWNKIAASRGINRVKSIVLIEEVFVKLTAYDGKLYFVLMTDGLDMGTSEMYESEAERESAIAAVKRYAPDAIVEEC